MLECKLSKKNDGKYIKINGIDTNFNSLNKEEIKVFTEIADDLLIYTDVKINDVLIVDLEKQQNYNRLLGVLYSLSDKTIELKTNYDFKVFYSLLDYYFKDKKCFITMDWIKDTRENNLYKNYFKIIEKSIDLVVDIEKEKQKKDFWFTEFNKARDAEFI